MDTLRALYLLFPEIGPPLCKRYESVDNRFRSSIEVKESISYLITSVESGKETRVSLRLILRVYFGLTLGKAVRLVKKLLEEVLPKLASNLLEAPTEVDDFNNKALALYIKGEYADARRLWRQGEIGLHGPPSSSGSGAVGALGEGSGMSMSGSFRSALNYELSSWKLGETQPIDIIR